jgi:glycine/D-amino acid oxidase-like deaminating enzyme
MWSTAPLNAVDIARLNGNYHADRGYLYYRTHAGRLLLGGGRNQDFASEQTTEWSENQRISEYLKAYSVDVLGLPPDLEWESRWSGTMGFTQSGLPHCLDLQNGDWLVAGMNGMGMALGPEMGRRVACMALQVRA